MTPIDYEYLQKILKDRSGLVLSADKKYPLRKQVDAAIVPGMGAGLTTSPASMRV